MIDKITNSEHIRVIRVLEYSGPAHWIEKTLERSLRSTFSFGNGGSIKEVCVSEEVLGEIGFEWKPWFTNES